jgi:hypothetical protein
LGVQEPGKRVEIECRNKNINDYNFQRISWCHPNKPPCLI